MRYKTVTAALSLAGLVGAQPALAEVNYNFSGFGTLGATHSDTRGADFRGSIIQPNGPGASGSTTFGVDTKLGVQGGAILGNGLSAVVQVIADHRADNTYRPEFEWANFKYQVDKTWYVRAGRVVAPVFMVSDIRSVGYAQTTVRPAYEVYMLNPITRLDGGEFGAKFNAAGGTLGFQATAGHFKVIVKSGGSQAIEVTGSAKNLGMTYEKGASTFHVGYTKTKANAKSDDLSGMDTLYSYGRFVNYPNPNADFHNIKTTLWDVGYIYDDGTWLAQVEHVQSRNNNAASPSSDAWSAMLGHRYGKLTPYVVASSQRSKQPPLKYPRATSPIPGNVQMEMLAGLINGVDDSISIRNQQHSLTLGARYELFKSVALKAQWDRTFKPAILPELNRGAFTNATAAFMQGAHTVNLYTVTLDFVF